VHRLADQIGWPSWDRPILGPRAARPRCRLPARCFRHSAFAAPSSEFASGASLATPASASAE